LLRSGSEQRETALARSWEADPETTFLRRIGKSPQELGVTSDTPDCPDVWELSNGDIAVIGRDMLIAAKPDIPSV
jgi:hypothetical protein